MSLSTIIPVMKYDLVKASIASLLLAERTNQIVLLGEAEKTETEIDNGYYFNVFKDLYHLPDASELPAINVYNAGGEFGTGMGKNYTDSKWHTYRMGLDCYSISCSEPGSEAYKLAAARLDYLFAQAFHTMNAQANFHKGLKTIVRTAKLLTWEQKNWGVTDNPAEVILAIQSIFELQFNEPTEIVTGEPLEMLVASLEIDDQFLSPFIVKQLTS